MSIHFYTSPAHYHVKEMDDGFGSKFVHVERYVIVEAQRGGLHVDGERVPYLLVPADIRKALKEQYNIDIIRDKPLLKFEVSFGEEEDRDGVALKVVYSIKKLEEAAFTGKYVGKTRVWRR